MRERMIAAILGAPGTGKTTLLRALLGAAKSRGVAFRALDPQHQIPGGDWPGVDGVDTWIDRILARQRVAVREHVEGRTSLIVLDDADFYIGKGNGGRLRELWTSNRHFDLDVILTARRAQSLPLLLLSACEWLYLFRLSPADVTGAERLRTILPPGLELPTERFQFLQVNLYTGRVADGITGARGDFRIAARAALPATKPSLLLPAPSKPSTGSDG